MERLPEWASVPEISKILNCTPMTVYKRAQRERWMSQPDPAPGNHRKDARQYRVADAVRSAEDAPLRRAGEKWPVFAKTKPVQQSAQPVEPRVKAPAPGSIEPEWANVIEISKILDCTPNAIALRAKRENWNSRSNPKRKNGVQFLVSDALKSVSTFPLRRLSGRNRRTPPENGPKPEVSPKSPKPKVSAEQIRTAVIERRQGESRYRDGVLNERARIIHLIRSEIEIAEAEATEYGRTKAAAWLCLLRRISAD